MIIPELINYIASERQKGVSDYIIKANFIAQGWSDADFAEAASKLPPAHPPSDAAALVSQLDRHVEWHPAEARSGTGRKAILVVAIGGALCGTVFLFQNAIGSYIVDTYDELQPFVSQTVQGMEAAIGLSQ